MKIFYAAHDQGNSVPESRTWFNNLYLPLCDIAEEVVRFDFDLFPLALHQDCLQPENKLVMDYYRPELEKALLQQIEKAHNEKPVDVFFSYFSSSYCSTKVIEKIKNMGIITINWFCNASYQFYLVKEIAPAYDYCLVPERFRINDYKMAGANPVYCQEAANPVIYKQQKTKKDIDISFVGSKYADRAFYINSLNFAGVNVNVWGSNWEKNEKVNNSNLKDILRTVYYRFKKIKPLAASSVHSYISDEGMVEIYNNSKINLGFAKCWQGPENPETIKQVRLRDFEVTMSGGFYLTERNDELADFFVPGKEIVFFENRKDCIEKAKYYLYHADEREEIRQAGYERAINEHTWQKRFQDIFRSIGKL